MNKKANVELRSVGAGKMKVLVDGHRMMGVIEVSLDPDKGVTILLAPNMVRMNSGDAQK